MRVGTLFVLLSTQCTFSSATQSCSTLCNPMDCSTPGFPVHHQLPEPTQTHVHHISDAIQPSHPLSSPSPTAFNLSQHCTFSSDQSLSHVRLCYPMNRSTPGLPVHHKLLEFTQTHVHWVSDAIQPSHPLSSPSPPAPNPSQYQGLFPVSQLFSWGGQSTGVSASASVFPMNIQDWSPLGWTGWISLQSKGLLRVFSNTTVQKHQFFGAQLSS